MMQAMLVDRERREAEQLEERRRWESDRQLKEEAFRELGETAQRGGDNGQR